MVSYVYIKRETKRSNIIQGLPFPLLVVGAQKRTYKLHSKIDFPCVMCPVAPCTAVQLCCCCWCCCCGCCCCCCTLCLGVTQANDAICILLLRRTYVLIEGLRTKLEFWTFQAIPLYIGSFDIGEGLGPLSPAKGNGRKCITEKCRKRTCLQFGATAKRATRFTQTSSGYG